MLNIILIYSISITILLLLLIFINRLIFYGKKNPKVPTTTIIDKIIRQTRPPKIKDDTHPENRFFFGDSSYKNIF